MVSKPIAAVVAGLTAFSMTPGAAQAATAILAGGCFWSVESNYDKVPGVTETVSGFIGGHVANPSYEDVVYTDTGHLEAVKITYDPNVISYDELLTVFWHTTDPTDPNGQFCDQGPNYHTAIFTQSPDQVQIAQQSKQQIAAESGYDIVTEIRTGGDTFYPAEEYHQDFHNKNPDRYQAYRIGCRRDAALEALWGNQAYLGTSENPFPQ